MKQNKFIGLVTLSNALVRAAHALSLSEKRLISQAIAALDKTVAPPPEGLELIVRAGDYSKTYDVSLDTAYDQLQAAAKHMHTRYLAWHEKDKDGTVGLVNCSWVYKATYYKTAGYISIRFTPDVTAHLVGLKDNFTSYRLRQASAFRSVYTWRLYELMMQFKIKEGFYISLTELHHALESPPSARRAFGQFRKFILDPALAELKGEAGVKEHYDMSKLGKKVTGLTFTRQESKKGRSRPGAAAETAEAVHPAADASAQADTVPVWLATLDAWQLEDLARRAAVPRDFDNLNDLRDALAGHYGDNLMQAQADLKYLEI